MRLIELIHLLILIFIVVGTQGCYLTARLSDLNGSSSSGGVENSGPKIPTAAVSGSLTAINVANKTSYSLSGSCSFSSSLQIKAGANVLGVTTCSAGDSGANGSWSFSGDFSSASEGNITIQIIDVASNTVLNSYSVLKDTNSPLVPSSFLDGILAFSLTDSPLFSWPAGSDPGGNVADYQIAIGDTTGGTNILDWTSVGNLLSFSGSGLSLQGSKRYYASIRTLDQAGNPSNIQNGDGWWNIKQNKIAVDSSSPIARGASGQAYFGGSVAISEDESTLVVGAYNESLDATGGNYSLSAGAVYIYIKVAGVWTLQQKLVATGTNARNSSDNFGNFVSISGDTILVGAPGQDYDESGVNYLNNAGAVYVFTRSAGVWSQQQKLVATGTNARIDSDVFGLVGDINGDTIAVGSYLHAYDENGTNLVNSAGAVFVYTRTAGVWSQQQKIVGVGTNARTSFSYFGASVAISADTIAVGAYAHSYDASGAGIVSSAGAAFIYTRTAGVWSLQQKLVASGTNGRVAGDQFGYSVAIDGDTLAVGANYQDYDAGGANVLPNAGAVYVFIRSVGVWSLQQKIVASGTNGRISSDWFGVSVSVHMDSLVVGAYGQDYDESGNNIITNGGAAYVYTRSAGVWSQQQKIVGSGTNARNGDDYFGGKVAISGDSIISGAYSQDYDANGSNYILSSGAAFVYRRSVGVWSQEQKIVDTIVPQNRMDLADSIFGQAVAISNDGLTMVVGAYFDDLDASESNYANRAGSAYVYTKVAGVWTLQQKLAASGANARTGGDFFGSSVAISGDTIVVGAYGHGYDATGANFMSGAGAAYVFTRTAGVWSQEQKLVATGANNRGSSDNFGYKVAISGDTIIVGANGQGYDAAGANYLSSAGAAYIYTRSVGVWSQQQKIVGTGTNGRRSNDRFGSSVAIEGDTVVVGATGQAYDASGANAVTSAGAIYVFIRNAGVWSIQQKITPTGTNARSVSDNFGNSVAISGESLVVGAFLNSYDINGANSVSLAGAAYVFTRSAGVWNQEQKLVATGTNERNASDFFGTSVSISGDSIVISSSRQEYDENGANSISNAGAAYVYTRVSGVWSQNLKLVATGSNARQVEDSFGNSVAISENGTSDGITIVVGAPGQDFSSSEINPSPGAGAVYIYH